MKKIKKIMRSTALILIILFCVISCPHVFHDLDYWKISRRINADDPIKDAELAIQKSDFRMYSMMGVGCYWPGLSSEEVDAFVDHDDYDSYLCFGDTSDAVNSDAHLVYMGEADSYAKRYNRTILTYLKNIETKHNSVKKTKNNKAK